MRLQSTVIPSEEIRQPQFLEMLRLMQTYYLNVKADRFRADLLEKDRVILLHEAGVLRGFSTWALYPYEIENRKVNIIFSGDTIIEKDCWRSMALPIAWGRLMLSALAEYPDRHLYWLLTSKGYKTYRFLPVFFNEYYPSFVKDTPVFEKMLLESFAELKFGRRFSRSKGILIASEADQKLVPGIADVTDIRRKDPHILFFEKKNPGHAHGDELVCIASCTPENINPFIKRFIKP
jgi:hypothetical protein